MKIYLCAAVLCFLFCSAAAQETDEIVIEMTGDSVSRPNEPSLWNFSAVQLTRKLRGKTREQVLYAVPVVSDKDRIVRSTGKEYALVEYYSGGDFRKFLFKAESPQTFVAAAANAADVLAVNKKYGINIGLPQAVFETFYAGQISAESSEFLPNGTILYKMLYRDINTPSPYNRWFLFEKNELSHTFENEADKNSYLDSLKKQAEGSSFQTKQQTARSSRQNRTVRKALISGGTAWDRANLPRVNNPTLLPTPSLKKADK